MSLKNTLYFPDSLTEMATLLPFTAVPNGKLLALHVSVNAPLATN